MQMKCSQGLDNTNSKIKETPPKKSVVNRFTKQEKFRLFIKVVFLNNHLFISLFSGSIIKSAV